MDGGLLAFLVAIITVAAALGIAWPVFRSKSTTATIDLLEKSLEVERRERKESAAHCDRRVSEMERRHQHELGELKGRLSALTPAFAQELAAAIAAIGGSRG